MKKIITVLASALFSIACFANVGLVDASNKVLKLNDASFTVRSSVKNVIKLGSTATFTISEESDKILPANCTFIITATSPTGETFNIWHSVTLPPGASCLEFAQITLRMYNLGLLP